jgi:hypothetical protein
LWVQAPIPGAGVPGVIASAEVMAKMVAAAPHPIDLTTPKLAAE